jgi:hypothetical protein
MTKAQKKAEAQAFLDAVGKAMKADAKEARRVAKIHGTKVWVMKDGKIVGLEPRSTHWLSHFQEGCPIPRDRTVTLPEVDRVRR